jgi:hypothetical protein
VAWIPDRCVSLLLFRILLLECSWCTVSHIVVAIICETVP